VFDDRTSRRVGAVVLALVGLAAGAVLTVDCTRLRPSIDVAVYFAHIGPLEEGADVQLAGRVIGKVDAVQLLPPGRVRDPSHPLHPGGGVAARLRIQERYAGWGAPNGEFFISMKGVLGDAYVEIGPPPGGAAPARGLRDGDEVRGVDPPRMDQVLVKSFQNMTEFRRLLDDAAPAARALVAALADLRATLAAIEPRPGAYAALGDSLGRAMDEWDRLSGGLGDGAPPGFPRTLPNQAFGRPLAGGASRADLLGVVGEAGRVLGRIRAELGATGGTLDLLLTDVDRIRARIPGDLVDRLVASAAGARAALARLERTIAVGQELIARVRGGQGTVGALLNDPEFIDDAKKLGKIIKREPWRVLGHPRREALERQE
jgi:phospholipid/cholesterol/gamma-HCH transport system substrate-binding protein